MFPDLIDFEFLHLKTYGVCMATGFLCAWKLIESLSGRRDFANLILSMMICGVVGSRLAYVIEHWSVEFAAHPERIIRVDQGGLMFYGGLILSLVVFVLWCLVRREPLISVMDVFAPALPLGHAFGRLGCFFFGCCYGRDSDAWCAVTFPIGSPSWHEHGGRLVKVLPTQLFEAAALVLLFVALYFVYRRFRRYTAGCYFIGYAVIRFGIEYLRGDPRAAVGPFSISQTISIAMLVIGVAVLWWQRKEERHA